jgi:hypothetical protein
VPCDEEGNALEAYPNGAGSVYDSHPRCECWEISLSAPDDVSFDDVDPEALASGDEQDTDQEMDITGDGESQEFDTSLPINDTPTITLNGDKQTVGKVGTSGKDWYWKKGERTISQDSSGTILTEDDILHIEYAGVVSWAILLALFAAGKKRQRDDHGVRHRHDDTQKARVTNIQERRRRRDAFRAFRESTLG